MNVKKLTHDKVNVFDPESNISLNFVKKQNLATVVRIPGRYDPLGGRDAPRKMTRAAEMFLGVRHE